MPKPTQAQLDKLAKNRKETKAAAKLAQSIVKPPAASPQPQKPASAPSPANSAGGTYNPAANRFTAPATPSPPTRAPAPAFDPYSYSPDADLNAQVASANAGTTEAKKNPLASWFAPVQTAPAPGDTRTRDERDAQDILGVGATYSYTGDPEDTARQMRAEMAAAEARKKPEKPRPSAFDPYSYSPDADLNAQVAANAGTTEEKKIPLASWFTPVQTAPAPGDTRTRDERDAQDILGVGTTYSYTGDPEDTARQMYTEIGAKDTAEYWQTIDPIKPKSVNRDGSVVDWFLSRYPWMKSPQDYTGDTAFYMQTAGQRPYNEPVDFFDFDPFAAIGNYLGGEASPLDPEYLQEFARMGQRSIPLNLINITLSENLSSLAELTRFAKDISGNPLGDILGSSDNYNALADEARQRSAESYSRLIEGKTELWKTLIDFGVDYSMLLSDSYLSRKLDIPRMVPNMLREFSQALDVAEKRGYNPRDQEKWAIYSMAKQYLSRLLFGYTLTEEDRELVSDTLSAVTESTALVNTAQWLTEDARPALVETVLETILPIAEYITGSTVTLDKEYLLSTIENQMDRKLLRLIGLEPELAEDEDSLSLVLPSSDSGNRESDNNPIENAEDNRYNQRRFFGSGKRFVDDPFDGNGHLLPDVEYVTGEFDYHYETDELGRIERWFTNDLCFTERGMRLIHDRNTPGKQKGDHAGHLAGDRFGGSNHLDNLVSQHWLINLGGYRQLENMWAAALREGKSVSVSVEVLYNGDNPRPSGFEIRSVIDGYQQQRTLPNF